jgi:alkylation response protein AidB-like acyl-CoA dehydrogenase
LLAYELPPPSARARELQERMHAFMRDRVLPAEGEYLAHRRAAGPDGHVLPPVVEKLKEQARAARHLVAMAKVAVPRAATKIIDRAIQIHGGAGVTDVTPLAAMYAWHRAMRLFDGPDEVHVRAIARAELNRTPDLEPR